MPSDGLTNINDEEAELLSRLQEVRLEKARQKARMAAEEVESEFGQDVAQFEVELSDQVNPLFSNGFVHHITLLGPGRFTCLWLQCA